MLFKTKAPKRGVTYLLQEEKSKRFERFKQNIVSVVLGAIVGAGLFYSADHAVENRNQAIGVSQDAKAK